MSQKDLPPVIDLHEDISGYYMMHGGGLPLGDFNEDILGRDADLPKYRKSNVRCIFASVFPGIESYSYEESKGLKELYGKWLPAIKYRVPQTVIWEHFTIYYKLMEAYGIKLVENFSDLERCIKGEGLCFILHLEGAEPIDDPYDLVLLKRMGLRSLGLTWNYTNKYATGCAARKDVGLTSEGEDLIKMANKLGIVIDLAHSSKRTALDALQVSKKPVIISHANVKAIVDKKRNIDDEVLELIYKSGGLIGISVIGVLVSNAPKPTLDDLAKHFTYIKESFSVDILAIGTDFLGLLGLPSPESLDNIGKLSLLYSKLLEKGFTEGDIQKITHLNALRVLKHHLD
ncbi:MAG: membrane dipeptidase [Desulfurococcaceae archaeon]